MWTDVECIKKKEKWDWKDGNLFISHRQTHRQTDIHNYKEKYAVCLFNSCQANYVSYLFHHFSPFSKS